MKWFLFAVVTYAPTLVWSLLTLPLLIKWPRIHKAWKRNLVAGAALTLLPYPLGYLLCHKSGLGCPGDFGKAADFAVMTGTVLLGFVLAGVWTRGLGVLMSRRRRHRG
jgi:hypothetical protein